MRIFIVQCCFIGIFIAGNATYSNAQKARKTAINKRATQDLANEPTDREEEKETDDAPELAPTTVVPAKTDLPSSEPAKDIYEERRARLTILAIQADSTVKAYEDLRRRGIASSVRLKGEARTKIAEVIDAAKEFVGSSARPGDYRLADFTEIAEHYEALLRDLK